MSSNSGVFCTEQRINLLRALWREGVSVKKIAETCSQQFQEPVTKNQVVGKIHRQAEYVSRPSPIILVCALKPPPKKKLSHDGPLPKLVEKIFKEPPETPRVIAFPQPAVVMLPIAAAEAVLPRLAGRRRDGSGCLFPSGTPRKSDYRICDGDLSSPNNSYCDECRKKAYLRRA